MATTPNYGWVMPDPTDFVTDLPADFEIFGDAVDTTLEAIETKLDVITTEGDLVVGDASGDPVRVPVGTVGQVLASDGDTVEWVTPASGGGMTLLSTTTLAGTSTTISSIDQNYTDLIILIESPRWDTANETLEILLNNESDKAFTSGVNETSTGTFGAVGLNGDVLKFSSGAQDRSSYGGFYCVIVKDYTRTYGGNNAPKPIQFFGALVSGDQRSFNHAGGFMSSVAVSSVVIRTTNNRSFAASNPGTVRIYGVK
jgi:hypothetical protein